jgi:hypothetical protein
MSEYSSPLPPQEEPESAEVLSPQAEPESAEVLPPDPAIDD